MKLKIATAVLAISLSSALIGCINDGDKIANNTVSKNVSIQALTSTDSSLAGQEVTITDANGKVVFKDSTDRIGTFSANTQVEDAQFPLRVKVGDLAGDIQKSDLDTAGRVALSLNKEGAKKGEFDPRFAPKDPQRELARICQLPKPSKEQMALIKPYVDQHLRVPDSLMPKLTTAQQSCVSAHKPIPTSGQLLAEKCNLPKPDSATELQIRKYIELKQPIPSTLLPKLSSEQQSCIDSRGGAINPSTAPTPTPQAADTGKAPVTQPITKDVITICNVPKLTDAQQKCKDDYTAKMVADSVRIDPLTIQSTCNLPVLTAEQQKCVNDWETTNNLIVPKWTPTPQPLAPLPFVDSSTTK